MKTHIPDTDITICSDRPEVDADWYDVTVVPRGMPCSWKLLQALKSADVVVWGGGALIADNAGRLLIPYWLLLIGCIRYILRKPVIAWAHGLVIETKTGALLGGMALRMANVVTVRDEGSQKTAHRIGVMHAKKTADPAILFQPNDASVGATLLQKVGIDLNRPIIAITPTFWQHYHRSRDLVPYAIARQWGFRKDRGIKEISLLIHALAETCDLLAEDMNAQIILLPRYASAPWPDVKYLHDIRSRSRHPDAITVYDQDLPPKEYFSIWHHMDAVLSVALHDAVVAAALEKPTVQIVYEEKGANFAKAIGSEDLTLSLTAFTQIDGPKKAAALVEKARNEWPNRLQKHQESISSLRDAAKENVQHLLALLQNT